MAKNKLPAADVTEDPHYHDTWTLLRKYRDVVWSPSIWLAQISPGQSWSIRQSASSRAIKCSALWTAP